MTTYPPAPRHPFRKLFEPTIEQRERGVVWVDHHGGEFADFTASAMLAMRAKRAARDWHRGQPDKLGRDYFMHHLWPVANMARAIGESIRFDAEQLDLAEAYAWCHDAGEDQGVDGAALAAESLDDLIEGIDLITHRKGTPYQPYVLRIATVGSIEVVVAKLADNLVNSTTLDDLPFDDQVRMAPKYAEARPVLMRRVARWAIDNETTGVC